VRSGILAVAIACAACGHAAPSTKTGETVHHAPTSSDGLQHGYATWYGTSRGQDGGPTASGETFHKDALTAAHRTLPMGTRVRVTNTRNGKSVVVRINDRGPYGHGRIIDLSEAAAKELDMIDAGTAPVTLEVIR
jgi:rare lipoprotein A